jgi:hypothetical protein
MSTPTSRQLRYLKGLADRTGQTFTYPKTSAEASAETDRLKGVQPQSGGERRYERESVRPACRELEQGYSAWRRAPEAPVRERPSWVSGWLIGAAAATTATSAPAHRGFTHEARERRLNGSSAAAPPPATRKANSCGGCASRTCSSVRGMRRRACQGGRLLGASSRTRLADRSIWFGGGRLARDLTLPSLRQGWQQDAGEQAAAVSDWGPWTQPAPRSPAQRIAELEERAVSWHDCIVEIDHVRSQLRAAAGDPEAVARVAHDAAGILAAWSVALEANRPGPLARSSRQLARSAEYRASRRVTPARPRPRSSTLALFLLAGARPDSTSG